MDRNRPPPGQIDDTAVVVPYVGTWIEIRRRFQKSVKSSVVPKIAHVLNERGIAVSQRTVSVYMREMGIKARYI